MASPSQLPQNVSLRLGQSNNNTAAMTSPKPNLCPPGQFPDPVIVSPVGKHRQTFIILHGRGSTAEKFAQPLLDMPSSSSGEKLQAAFPDAKLVFLTASRNRATIYKRSYTHQWFDHWHMEEPNNRQDLMGAGLHKSCKYVHEILNREIEDIGEENVVLWGLRFVRFCPYSHFKSRTLREVIQKLGS